MSAATGRTTIVFDRMIAKPGPYFFQSKKPSSPDLRFASRDGDCDHLAPFLGRQNEKDRARAWHPQMNGQPIAQRRLGDLLMCPLPSSEPVAFLRRLDIAGRVGRKQQPVGD
jgi:hypothetical protein